MVARQGNDDLRDDRRKTTLSEQIERLRSRETGPPSRSMLFRQIVALEQRLAEVEAELQEVEAESQAHSRPMKVCSACGTVRVRYGLPDEGTCPNCGTGSLRPL